LAKQLEVNHPGAAASLLEDLEETLTVTRLGLSPSLLRTFKSINPVESMISISRTVAGNVKRSRNGKMVRGRAARSRKAIPKSRRLPTTAHPAPGAPAAVRRQNVRRAQAARS
jgi:hypothetical protein